MKNNISQPLKILLLALVLAAGVGISEAAPYFTPIAIPPTSNTPFPILGETSYQSKTNAFQVGALSANNIILSNKMTVEQPAVLGTQSMLPTATSHIQNIDGELTVKGDFTALYHTDSSNRWYTIPGGLLRKDFDKEIRVKKLDTFNTGKITVAGYMTVSGNATLENLYVTKLGGATQYARPVCIKNTGELYQCENPGYNVMPLYTKQNSSTPIQLTASPVGSADLPIIWTDYGKGGVFSPTTCNAGPTCITTYTPPSGSGDYFPTAESNRGLSVSAKVVIHHDTIAVSSSGSCKSFFPSGIQIYEFSAELWGGGGQGSGAGYSTVKGGGGGGGGGGQYVSVSKISDPTGNFTNCYITIGKGGSQLGQGGTGPGSSGWQGKPGEPGGSTTLTGSGFSHSALGGGVGLYGGWNSSADSTYEADQGGPGATTYPDNCPGSSIVKCAGKGLNGSAGGTGGKGGIPSTTFGTAGQGGKGGDGIDNFVSSIYIISNPGGHGNDGAVKITY